MLTDKASKAIFSKKKPNLVYKLIDDTPQISSSHDKQTGKTQMNMSLRTKVVSWFTV